MLAPVQAVLLTASAPGIIGGNEFINLRVYGTGRTDFDHAFYIQSSSNLIEDCEIYDIPGGAVHIYNGYGHVISNTVVRNNVIRDGRFVSAARGWGVIVANGSTGAKIYNNLVYNIRNTGGTSGGIYVYSGSNTEVYNNTVYGNAAHGIFVENRIGTIVRNNISYQNAKTNYTNQAGSNTAASNNLFSNPLFVSAGTRDFRLQSSSAAVDAGTTIPIVVNDLAGLGRPQRGAYDIGAFEFPGDSTLPPAPPSDVRIAQN
jgi:parallel beta-helix repeat protein